MCQYSILRTNFFQLCGSFLHDPVFQEGGSCGRSSIYHTGTPKRETPDGSLWKDSIRFIREVSRSASPSRYCLLLFIPHYNLWASWQYGKRSKGTTEELWPLPMDKAWIMQQRLRWERHCARSESNIAKCSWNLSGNIGGKLRLAVFEPFWNSWTY